MNSVIQAAASGDLPRVQELLRERPERIKKRFSNDGHFETVK
jgi:hypothetical protein